MKSLFPKLSIFCSLYLTAGVIFAFAQCIVPRITADASSGQAGAKVTISGKGFMDGCHDVCENGNCPPTFPAKGIRILFVQSGKTTEVGRVDANEKFELTLAVVVPADAKTGAASTNPLS